MPVFKGAEKEAWQGRKALRWRFQAKIGIWIVAREREGMKEKRINGSDAK